MHSALRTRRSDRSRVTDVMRSGRCWRSTMPELADVLERESRSVDLEQGDFERLLGRRERKQRNRRLAAGAVGVIVALATAAALVRSIESESVPADPPKPLGAREVLVARGGPARPRSQHRRRPYHRRYRGAPRWLRG